MYIFKSQLPKLLFTCLILTSSAANAQKQGNIVEYFGKEKVTEISEGTLKHLFKDGLVLPLPSGRFESTTPSDPIFEKYLMVKGTDIAKGKVFDADYKGKALIWETVKVDEKNEFQDPRLRSGYLYLVYNSTSTKTVLLDASGHTRLMINGMPHEGDHYDFGYNLIPVKLKKGKNEFILKGGRFPRIRARLISPSNPIQLTKRDMTTPDILKEDNEALFGAIRVVNSLSSTFRGGKLICTTGEWTQTTQIPSVTFLNQRKIAFKIPVPTIPEGQNDITYKIELKDRSGKLLDTKTIKLQVKSKYKHHKRTFVSGIDGSVQYYSVAPSTSRESNQAMFLSVHGASVEATNQARAYKQKDWGHLVAPTNRRPFGFAWEDWGRLDALEVLQDAENIYQTDKKRTYLTGHSMGGHGTWYLGATYPDKFGAIAPCAGYPDLLLYRNGFTKRLATMSDEQLRRFGISKADLARMNFSTTSPFDEIVPRAGNPSRTLKLLNNYSHYGVYVLHGEKDTVVPTDIARDMRKRLGEFHSDFTYYEYPSGTHWYGNHSVDWPPIFDFFKARTIKDPSTIDHLTFHTASPGVSSKSNFVKISQQIVPFEISSFEFSRSASNVDIITNNIEDLSVDLTKMGYASKQELKIDDQNLDLSDTTGILHLQLNESRWEISENAPALDQKGPHRNGGFKDAFRNGMVFVYATNGTKEENDWYYNRARLDAETFWYRANGNVEIVADDEFKLLKYPDRNVIVYGNADNNSSWKILLSNSPLQVRNNSLQMDKVSLSGTKWGAYFVFPRADSDVASVGVVTATGRGGMKAAYANHYLVNGTTFPDVMIFDENYLSQGMQSIKCAGFWSNEWTYEKGDFVWK